MILQLNGEIFFVCFEIPPSNVFNLCAQCMGVCWIKYRFLLLYISSKNKGFSRRSKQIIIPCEKKILNTIFCNVASLRDSSLLCLILPILMMFFLSGGEEDGKDADSLLDETVANSNQNNSNCSSPSRMSDSVSLTTDSSQENSLCTPERESKMPLVPKNRYKNTFLLLRI